MNSQEMVLYLANVILISTADGELSEEEGEAIEALRKEIGADEEELKKALEAVVQGRHNLQPVGRFSDRVRNLEDMVYVSLADGKMSGAEKPDLLSFAKQIRVSQAQMTEIVAQAKGRCDSGRKGLTCSSCGKGIPPDSKFCPFCGGGL